MAYIILSQSNHHATWGDVGIALGLLAVVIIAVYFLDR